MKYKEDIPIGDPQECKENFLYWRGKTEGEGGDGLS
jgi:hypothetical protein